MKVIRTRETPFGFRVDKDTKLVFQPNVVADVKKEHEALVEAYVGFQLERMPDDAKPGTKVKPKPVETMTPSG